MKNKNHIIPQLILRRYSTIPNHYTAHHLWLHNTYTKQDKFVPMKAQCQKHRLYELYGEDNQIIAGTENAIENLLAEIETKTAPIIQKVQEKQTLTDEDRGGLLLFTAIQILRTPESLQVSAQYFHRKAPHISQAQTQRLALIMGLLVQPNLQNNTTLVNILEWLDNYKMVIWCAPWNNSFILNQKRPVGVFMPTRGDVSNAIVTYPITATRCLAFIHDDHQASPDYRPIENSWVDWVNYHNYTNDSKIVYSKYIVTELPFYKRLVLPKLQKSTESIHTFLPVSHN